MFKITSGKGFHITFANGYTVSVQFGPGNYCENYQKSVPNPKSYEKLESECGEKGSKTAECAVWSPNCEMIEYGDWGNTVSNRSTPEEVLELLNWAAAQ